MSPEVERRAFDPFFSTKLRARGIGLSVVMGIVRAHRGTVDLETSPGRGSVVTAYLPLCEEAPDAT
jgi:signal transduction histidine kinase